MTDQAQELRNLIKHQGALQGEKSTRIITITSGKGGVGKSNFTLNFALALQNKGFKVLIFDADIGLANIDVLMGITSKYSLYHLLKRERTVWDIINTGPQGLQFIAGGSGFNDLIRLSEEQLDYFADQVNQLNGHVDFILFDTGAGLSKETLKFILAAQETIVVTTPEPTSITDAYAIIKMVHSMDHNVNFRLVVNRVLDWKEGRQTADKISMVAKQFMNLDIPTIGYVWDDAAVSRAVRKQVPFMLAFPESSAAKSLGHLTNDFLANQMPAETQSASVKGFLNRMVRLLKQ
ncbi:MinD/ParA family protein [Paenibacillus filicis]|uniref:MinD/ParA family protein n=1 Tax=Paenibacillus filicis TaxID=669464 RepID=A0ABU9DR31_9BACL